MKKSIVAFLFLLFVFSYKTEAIIVHDTTRMLKFVAEIAKVLKKFDEYKTIFDSYVKYNRFFNRNFYHTIFSIPQGILDELEPDEFLFILRVITHSSYYAHTGGLDIWRRILNDAERIIDRYPSLKKEREEEIVRKNPYYKDNKGFRKFQEENLKQYGEYLKNLKIRQETLADMRKMDTKRGEKMLSYKDLIRESAGSGDTPGAFANRAKLIILLTNMEYEELIQTMQTMVLLRDLMENEIKKEVFLIDYEKRRRILNKDKDKNVELIKQLYEYMP